MVKSLRWSSKKPLSRHTCSVFVASSSWNEIVCVLSSWSLFEASLDKNIEAFLFWFPACELAIKKIWIKKIDLISNLKLKDRGSTQFFFKKMVNISWTFVVYHGCGNGYFDGTRKIVPKNRKCIRPTHYLFWKKPINVHNRVETRAQISLKPKATRDYVKRYMHYLNVFSK